MLPFTSFMTWNAPALNVRVKFPVGRVLPTGLELPQHQPASLFFGFGVVAEAAKPSLMRRRFHRYAPHRRPSSVPATAVSGEVLGIDAIVSDGVHPTPLSSSIGRPRVTIGVVTCYDCGRGRRSGPADLAQPR